MRPKVFDQFIPRPFWAVFTLGTAPVCDDGVLAPYREASEELFKGR
jgi:hypothetical protein